MFKAHGELLDLRHFKPKKSPLSKAKLENGQHAFCQAFQDKKNIHFIFSKKTDVPNNHLPTQKNLKAKTSFKNMSQSITKSNHIAPKKHFFCLGCNSPVVTHVLSGCRMPWVPSPTWTWPCAWTPATASP